jgi:transcription elongation factor GreA
MKKFPITQQEYLKLEKEIKQLKYTDRPAIINAIAIAREFGDLSENAEYQAAREKQSFIEGRILDLEDKLSRAEIIDTSKLSPDSVKFGATVKLIDNNTLETFIYHIVGEYESDITRSMISTSSPLAKALIGKSLNNTVEVKTPKGNKSYKVLQISFNKINL